VHGQKRLKTTSYRVQTLETDKVNQADTAKSTFIKMSQKQKKMTVNKVKKLEGK